LPTDIQPTTAIIPAHPGFFLVQHSPTLEADGTLEHWVDPIIAWLITGGLSKSALPAVPVAPTDLIVYPITTAGVATGMPAVMRPDGSIDDGQTTWTDLADWLSTRRKELAGVTG
jgi:hypothetical protein